MSPKGCFIRTGTSTNYMSEQMIMRLFSKRIRNSLSNIISPRQDLTFKKLKIYYQESGYALNYNFTKSLELITEDGQYNYNAYLFSDENMISIKVAEYRGETKVNLITNNEYGYRSLISAADKVLDKLDVHNTTNAIITGEAKRLQWNNIDKRSLREAVINAIVHNDYTNEVPPLFEIYYDRIEITSMGGLPEGMTVDEFFEGVSKPRNKVIMRIFKDLNMVEQLGSGVLRILEKYDRSIFKISDNYIKITFHYKDKTAINGDKTAINGNKTAINKDYHNMIIRYAEENSSFKNGDIQKLINLKSSRVREHNLCNP